MSEPDVSGLVTVAEAIRILDAQPVHVRPEAVALEAAQGLWLVEPVRADRDYPPFDKSLMDGYALRRADAVPGRELTVTGELAAGAWPTRAVGPGEAVAIMTGAPMPDGADAVVPVEMVQRQGDAGAERIRIAHGNGFDRFVQRRGAEVRQAAVVLEAGVQLNAPQLAVAATVGAVRPVVGARARVAVLSTGDELVDPAQTPRHGQIRNANSILLMAALYELGCDVTDLGVVADRAEAVAAALADGLRYDALFVSGGMSMGEYDYVPATLEQLGVQLKITRLKIKPGKPFVFGVSTRDDGGTCHVFGLPGNPVSGFVCARRLALRLIVRMMGGPVREPWEAGVLAEGLPPNGPREFYQPAVLLDGTVRPLRWVGSADLFTLAKANALLVRPAGDGERAPGDRVTVLRL